MMRFPTYRRMFLAAFVLSLAASQSSNWIARPATAGEAEPAAADSQPIADKPEAAARHRTLDERLRDLDGQIESARAAIEKAKEVMDVKPEDLEHDPNLPREEQLQRHKLRVQQMVSEYRLKANEENLEILNKRRDAIRSYMTRIDQRFNKALGGAAEGVQISAETRRQAIEAFRRETEAERAQVKNSITSAALAIQREINLITRLDKQIEAFESRLSTATAQTKPSPRVAPGAAPRAPALQTSRVNVSPLTPRQQERLNQLREDKAAAQDRWKVATDKRADDELRQLVLEKYLARADEELARLKPPEPEPAPPSPAVAIPKPEQTPTVPRAVEPAPVPTQPTPEALPPPLAPREVAPLPEAVAPERKGDKQTYTFTLKPPVQIVLLEVPEPADVQRAGGAGGFLRDRLLDLGDLFRFRFHMPRGGRGIGIKARGTCLAQVGLVYFDGKSAGIDRRGAGIWDECRFEGGIGPAYLSSVQNEMARGNRYTDVRHPWSRLHKRGIVRNDLYWDDGRRHPLSCGTEFQLALFGLEVETYPIEWFDLVLGWVGLDPVNDDDCRLAARWDRLQTIPELAVRDEWSESLAQYEAKKPKPPEDTRRGRLVERKPGEEPAPPPIEAPIEEPEALPLPGETATPEQ